MQNPLSSLDEAVFRANPAYELRAFERLPDMFRQALGELGEDDDCYGMLLPAEPGALQPKAVDANTALLFYTLGEPSKMPRFVKSRFGGSSRQAFAKLVMDDVLEIESGDGFVSGAVAHDRLFEPREAQLGEGRVAALSRDALTYAQALPVDHAAALSLRLYCYNTAPASPGRRQRLGEPEAVAAFLGIDHGGAARALLARHWRPVSGDDEADGWFHWQAPDRGGFDAGQPTYKLYISPALDALPDALPLALNALAAEGVANFKFGRDLPGLLRPDKFVAYFSNFEALAAAADRLKTALAGCEAQGVPFTAGIDDHGLLSWGVDPPRRGAGAAWRANESYRLWTTNRLAAAMIAAKRAGDREPWRFAVQRLQMEGVDTRRWTPAQNLWRTAEEA